MHTHTHTHTRAIKSVHLLVSLASRAVRATVLVPSLFPSFILRRHREVPSLTKLHTVHHTYGSYCPPTAESCNLLSAQAVPVFVFCACTYRYCVRRAFLLCSFTATHTCQHKKALLLLLLLLWSVLCKLVL